MAAADADSTVQPYGSNSHRDVRIQRFRQEHCSDTPRPIGMGRSVLRANAGLEFEVPSSSVAMMRRWSWTVTAGEDVSQLLA